MTEEAFAGWQGEQGTRSFVHLGRHWSRVTTGFYAPIHPVARLDLTEAVPPPVRHWGFRAVLSDRDAASANGTLPVHLLRDVASYDASQLSSNRRKQLRKCHNRVTFVALTDSTVLTDEGHGVVLSALARTGHARPPSSGAYRAAVRGYAETPHRLVIAGFVDDALGGYISGHVVDGTAYFEDLYVASEVLTTNMTLGLIYELVQAFRESGQVDEVVNGLHAREDPALDTFKESIGFPVVHLPTRVHVHPWARALLQWRYPDKLYRLVGDPAASSR
jgi:hypothetical protein